VLRYRDNSPNMDKAKSLRLPGSIYSKPSWKALVWHRWKPRPVPAYRSTYYHDRISCKWPLAIPDNHQRADRHDNYRLWPERPLFLQNQERENRVRPNSG